MRKYHVIFWLALFYALLLTPRLAAQTLPVQDVQFVGGPNIGTFAETTTIERVDVRNNGVEVTFSKRDGAGRWPDAITPGWQGPLQYSLGMAMQVGGVWYASAPIETWYGNNSIGGAITDQTLTCPTGMGQIHCNWFYDARWSPLQTAHPMPGDAIGLFVAAGDARNDYNPLRERSNIVVIRLPAAGVEQTFTFAAAPTPTPAPTPEPPVPPVVVPPIVPAPLPATDYTFLLNALQGIQTQLAADRAQLAAFQTIEEAHWQKVSATWKSVVTILTPIITTITLLLKSKGL